MSTARIRWRIKCESAQFARSEVVKRVNHGFKLLTSVSFVEKLLSQALKVTTCLCPLHTEVNAPRRSCGVNKPPGPGSQWKLTQRHMRPELQPALWGFQWSTILQALHIVVEQNYEDKGQNEHTRHAKHMAEWKLFQRTLWAQQKERHTHQANARCSASGWAWQLINATLCNMTLRPTQHGIIRQHSARFTSCSARRTVLNGFRLILPKHQYNIWIKHFAHWVVSHDKTRNNRACYKIKPIKTAKSYFPQNFIWKSTEDDRWRARIQQTPFHRHFEKLRFSSRLAGHAVARRAYQSQGLVGWVWSVHRIVSALGYCSYVQPAASSRVLCGQV